MLISIFYNHSILIDFNIYIIHIIILIIVTVCLFLAVINHDILAISGCLCTVGHTQVSMSYQKI
jgi:hypothetical protein